MNQRRRALSLSVVVPVYNEVSTVGTLIKRVLASPYPDEVVVVDDGSTDGTVDELAKLQKRGPKKLAIYLKKTNEGKGAAVRFGIKKAKSDYILVQDADLEYEVSDYKALIQPVISGKSLIVYGTRFNKGNHLPMVTYIANRTLTLITKMLFRSSISDMECCYKLFPKDLALNLNLKSKRFDFEPEITAKIIKGGHKIHEVPVRYYPRTKKEGKKIGNRDGFEALWALFRFRFLEK